MPRKPIPINQISRPKDAFILTHSARQMLFLCPKKFWYRYVQELVPIEQVAEPAFWFGTAIHAALEMWYESGSLNVALDIINSIYLETAESDRDKTNWLKARAMIRAYCNQFPQEKYEVVALEKFIEGPIINPGSGYPSTKLWFAGKLDALVQDIEENHWLWENKTASSVGADYRAKIVSDPQVYTYVQYLDQSGTPIHGIVYNVLEKPAGQTKQKIGETEEEYQLRYVEACAKAKNGKSAAKRQFPETDDEFEDRVFNLLNTPEKFWRQEFLVDKNQQESVHREFWETGQIFLRMRQADCWLKNRTACYKFRADKPCAYWDVCAAGSKEEEADMIAAYLTHKRAHEELADYLYPEDGQVDTTANSEPTSDDTLITNSINNTDFAPF